MVYLYCYSIYILLTQEPIKFDGLLVDNKIIFFTFFEKENHFSFLFSRSQHKSGRFFFFVRMRQPYPIS